MTDQRRSERINLAGSAALVCDPSPSEQDVIAAMLNGFGLNRITRLSDPGRLALDAAKAYDLIFVGVSAIDPDALKGIADLRRAVDHPSRASPIIVVSSYTPLTMIDDARNVGATFVLTKPLISQIVFDRILWLASTDRDFIETETYFGPDRRVRSYGPPPGETGRRAGDLSSDIGAPQEFNMSQDDIDSLMKPTRVAL